MSSISKDPNEKQDTPPESVEPQSDSELSETEDHMEHLEIAERAAKEKAEDKATETKMIESSNQEGSQVSQREELDEPVAGPSGLQNPNLTDSESLSEAELVCMQEQNNENIQEEVAEQNNDVAVNIGADRENENREDSLSGDSGHGSVHYIASRLDPPAIRRRGHRRDDDRFPDDIPPSSSSILSIPTDSAHSSVDTHELPDSGDTSEGISDIQNEVVYVSAGGTEYFDAREKVMLVDPPSVYVSAVESQNSVSSDATTASDLPEDSVSKSASASVSTNTGEEGHQAYLTMLQKEADERGDSISSSSGETFTNQSELANLDRWTRVGEMVNQPDLNVADPIKEATEIGGQKETSQPVSEQMEDEPILASASKQEETIGKNEASRPQGEPRKPALCHSDSSSSEKAAKMRPRVKRVTLKCKPVEIKFNVSSEGSSGSPVPKSSSSEELNRTESLDSTSTSEGSPRSKTDKKSWQKAGQLRSMQHSTVMTDVNIDEDDLSSPLVSPNPIFKPCVESDFKDRENAEEKMETSPEKTETRVEKNVEEVAEKESTGQASSDQAVGLKVDIASDVDEISFEQSDFERSARQTKRPGGRLSRSPSSDEGLGSTPPKDSSIRPKKKAKDDKKQPKLHRTRTDSEGSLSGGGSLEVLEEENAECPPCQSDYEEDDKSKSAKKPETNGTK